MPRTVSSPDKRVVPTGSGKKAAKPTEAPASAKPAKAARKGKAAAPAPTAAPTGRIVTKRFSREDLHALELGQLQVKSSEQAALLQRHAMEDFARKAQDALKAERSKFDEAVKLHEAARADLAKTYARLEADYGVKMTEITYDPQTGLVRQLPPRLDAAQAASEAAGGAIVPVE